MMTAWPSPRSLGSDLVTMEGYKKNTARKWELKGEMDEAIKKNHIQKEER